VKLRFILNPRSGAAQRARPKVEAFAAQHGASLAVTERPRHASELAVRAIAEGCDVIAAVGGDGTMNEIASALIGTSATLALIPCGSGDGLGRHLGIHGTIDHALSILTHGQSRLIDSGLADGHPFFTAAGLGFEADVAERFNHLTHRGFINYLRTSAAMFRAHQPATMTIEHPGGRESRPVFTLAVGNSDQYGNNARIAPAARIDDGLLNLTAVSRVTSFNALPLLGRLFSGRLRSSQNVLTLAAPHFVVERPAPGFIHTDGEIHSAGSRVEFIVRPKSLRILTPRG
jgi:YegS/Rv2252/BmrU family lipid kinase